MDQLSTVEPGLLSVKELTHLVRQIIIGHDLDDDRNLVFTIGGIRMVYAVKMDDDRRTLHCELRGPKWTLFATMKQDNAKMEFSPLMHIMGEREPFDADIIYIKIALS